jgi:hypothetical protein
MNVIGAIVALDDGCANRVGSGACPAVCITSYRRDAPLQSLRAQEVHNEGGRRTVLVAVLIGSVPPDARPTARPVAIIEYRGDNAPLGLHLDPSDWH